LPIVGVWIADGGQCRALAAQAVRERHTHLAYLEALLAAEVDERERHAIARRLKDAHLPRVKTLDEFDFSQASKVSATQIRELADGGYIARTEPVVLIGDCGTGKTHLLTGLCVAACRQEPRAIHHRCRAGQRAGRSETRDAARPRARPMGAV
jgi:DNA replication protein DnaC